MKTDVTFFLDESEKPIILDVRSPSEFEKGHIPNAVSFPLFSDEERAIVGTIYKQKSPEMAMLEGLEIIGPKMANFVRSAHKLGVKKTFHIHCWRGGKRSGSMSWLLELSGLKVNVLNGGYKAYRREIIQKITKAHYQFIILAGLTGAGKTDILYELKSKGAQILDLEGLAHHKGSAFGHIGELPQPSNEQFANNLFYALSKLDINKPVWVEGESRSIGRIYIFQEIWDKMQAAPRIELDVPYENRVNKLVEIYGDYPIDELKAAFEKIKKRIGPKAFKDAIIALDKKDLKSAVEIALFYYDKSYKYTKSKIYKTEPNHFDFDGKDREKDLDGLIKFGGNVMM